MQRSASLRSVIPHGNSFAPRVSKKGRSDRRTKATRACDKCRKSKTKCSGDKPCTVCIAIGLEHECTYDTPYSRGLPPKIQTNPARERSNKFSYPNSSIAFNSFYRQEERPVLPKGGSNGEPPSGQSMAPSFPDSPRTAQQSLSVHVTAFGDLPVPFSPMVALPNTDVGAELVANYFAEVSPSMLFLHVPSVLNWATDLLSDDGDTLHKGELRCRNAIVILVFASAQAHCSGFEAKGSDSSMLYYRLADEQLQSETGPPQIVSVQARLLQCYYLLARGRINQCWTTFGSVVSLIYSLGLHRKHREEEYPNLIDFECQKRVFWAAFCLDKFLTYALDDRPPRIELDNTDQDMPKFIDDRELTSSFLLPSLGNTLTLNFASNLQIELAITTSKILKDIYGMRKPNIETRLKLANSYTSDLKAWYQKAGPLLHADFSQLEQVKIFKQQKTDLLLAYHHANILLLRNLLLEEKDSKSSDIANTNAGPIFVADEDELDSWREKLADACLSICEIVEVMEKQSERRKIELAQSLSFRSSWFTQYIMYSTALIIYMNGHLNPSAVTSFTCMILRKSHLLHHPLSIVGKPGTFMGQCVTVLNELKEALDERVEQYKITQRDAEDGEEVETGSASESEYEYEDPEVDEHVVRKAQGHGGQNGYGDMLRGRDEDMHMGNGMHANGREVTMDGKIPIMERIDRWGFTRLNTR